MREMGGDALAAFGRGPLRGVALAGVGGVFEERPAFAARRIGERGVERRFGRHASSRSSASSG